MMFNTDLIKTKEKLKKEIELLIDQTSAIRRKIRDFELDLKVKEREADIKIKTNEDYLSGRFKNMEIDLEKKHKSALNEKNEKIKELERKIDEMEKAFNDELEKNTLILKLDFEKKLLEEKTKIQTDYLDDVKKNEKEFYTKLKTELASLHTEGNLQTNFVKDFAEKMLASKLEEKRITMVSNGSNN